MAQHDCWVIGWYAVKNQISLNTRYIYLSIYICIYIYIYIDRESYIYIYMTDCRAQISRSRQIVGSYIPIASLSRKFQN